MFTMSGGKICGECLASADESELPVSTSSRTSPSTCASSLFSVWSARMFSERSSESPLLIIVANCRDMIARSLSLTLGPKPGIAISAFIPARDFEIRTGA